MTKATNETVFVKQGKTQGPFGDTSIYPEDHAIYPFEDGEVWTKSKWSDESAFFIADDIPAAFLRYDCIVENFDAWSGRFEIDHAQVVLLPYDDLVLLGDSDDQILYGHYEWLWDSTEPASTDPSEFESWPSFNARSAYMPGEFLFNTRLDDGHDVIWGGDGFVQLRFLSPKPDAADLQMTSGSDAFGTYNLITTWGSRGSIKAYSIEEIVWGVGSTASFDPAFPWGDDWFASPDLQISGSLTQNATLTLKRAIDKLRLCHLRLRHHVSVASRWRGCGHRRVLSIDTR